MCTVIVRDTIDQLTLTATFNVNITNNPPNVIASGIPDVVIVHGNTELINLLSFFEDIDGDEIKISNLKYRKGT